MDVLDKLLKYEQDLAGDQPAPDPKQELIDRAYKVNSRRFQVSIELGACQKRLEELFNNFPRTAFENFDDLAREYAFLVAKRDLLAHANQALQNEHASLLRKAAQTNTHMPTVEEFQRAAKIQRIKYQLGDYTLLPADRMALEAKLEILIAEGGDRPIFVDKPFSEDAPMPSAGIEATLQKHEQALRQSIKDQAEADARKKKSVAPPAPSAKSKESMELRWLRQRAKGRREN